MRRGDLVTVALQGDLGKPRPALVVQCDLFDEHPPVTVLPVTSEQVDAPLFRLTLLPDAGNGLLSAMRMPQRQACTPIAAPMAGTPARPVRTAERQSQETAPATMRS